MPGGALPMDLYVRCNRVTKSPIFRRGLAGGQKMSKEQISRERVRSDALKGEIAAERAEAKQVG